MHSLGAIRPSWPSRRGVAFGIAAAITALSLLASGGLYYGADLKVGPNEFNLPAWELRNLPGKWMFLLGEKINGEASAEEQDAAIVSFLRLTREIEQLERQTLDGARSAELAAKLHERDKLENQVEATIESRITAVLRDFNIQRSALGFTGVWPPVDFELTDSPRSLVTSPREKIELKSTELLRPDLDLLEIEAIEAKTEKTKGVSALAFPTGGIGAYPTVVNYDDDYRRLLAVVAHEWTHNYLVFSPLGFNYYKNDDLRTMNETVADLVGEEVARQVLARWPLPSSPPAEAPASPAPAPSPTPTPVDTGAVLRQLRLDVDALLAAGKVDEAEALMEQRRQELAAQGVFFRKLNQAYFAFTNLYAGAAGNPAAVNPIGPKLDELRRRTGSLDAFVRAVGGVTSVAELDAALEKYE